MKQLPLPFTPFVILSAAALFALGGCGAPAVPRDLMAEEARRGGEVERPVAMKGEAEFAGGKLHAVATVSRGFNRGPGKGGPMPEQKKRFFRKDTDAFSESYDFGYYGESEEEQKEAIKDYMRQAMARRAAGSPMPPVTLNVHFQNRGTEPIEITPIEVNSDLGNFAARPAKLTIAPGENASLDPMISQLGVTSDEIPLTLGVRVGTAKTETRVVVVRNVLSAAAMKEAK